MKGYLTVTEAAKELGCTKEYITRLIRQGRLKAERAGPIWLVSQRSLAAYTPAHQGPRGSRKVR